VTIVTGVGITALGVAAGRAIETHRQDGLVTDAYAEAFVHAAGSPVPMPTRPDADGDPEIPWTWLATYMGVRSRFFDEFFAGVSAAGLDQIVLFAAALWQAGFDARRPTAWLAEGLLPFLPDDARDRLFARVHDLSAAGSQIAVEHIDGDPVALRRSPLFQKMADRLGFDVGALWPTDQHYDPAAWLADHGWVVSTARAAAVAQRY
jgi:O-methyltransferase involved in polyketide biosynthesis